MADVLLSTEDLIVVGGPSQISISLDVGATGDSGSMIYHGSGNPNSSSTQLGFTPRLLDMYINLDPTDAGYQYLYQYQTVFGVPEWVPLFRMFTNTYRKNTLASETVFVDGSVEIFVKAADVVPADMVDQLSPEDFNIQYSIIGSSPIISAISVANTYSLIGQDKFIKITIAAEEKEGNGSSTTPINGQRVVHLFITVV